jgi:hypothetical protein
MTRQVTALVCLSPLALFAQPQPSPNEPTFSQADMMRLLTDMAKVFRANIISGTQPLAKQYSEEIQKAAKAPVAQRAAAMQKATDDYRKRVDAFNQGGQPGADVAAAESMIRNPMHPENGFYKNLLGPCLAGAKFLTRTEDGTPVLQQVTVEGATTIIHSFPLGLPVEKTAPSKLSPQALCPTLVRNAVLPSPPTLAEASAPPLLPKTLQLCGAACATLAWRNGRYEVMARDGELATIYTVESFTHESIVMKRTELPHSGDYGLTATYKGTFEDGSDTAQGTVDFAWPGKPGYPHSGKWKASWGDAIASARPPAQRRPEERGDAEEAQANTAREQQARTITIGALGFLAAMLGAGPNIGSGGFVGGDPAARIRELQSRLDELSSKCSADTYNRTGACAKARDTREDLSDAHAALSREIENLKAQADRLQKDCSAHVAGACDKLNRVKAKLEDDIEVSLGSVF